MKPYLAPILDSLLQLCGLECRHEHTTFPMGKSPNIRETCLDCGRSIKYNWNRMERGEVIALPVTRTKPRRRHADSKIMNGSDAGQTVFSYRVRAMVISLKKKQEEMYERQRRQQQQQQQRTDGNETGDRRRVGLS